MKSSRTAPQRLLRPSGRLVPHPIRVSRHERPGGTIAIVATVDCQREECSIALSVCTRCKRFAHIAKGESGATLVCRPDDEQPMGFEPIPLLIQLEADGE